MAARVSKRITDPELLKTLLEIKESDITSSFIYDLFGEFGGVAKCNPYDIIVIPAGSYGSEKKKNKKPFTTTVGIWIFNKWFIEPELFDELGYINKNINKKAWGNINQTLSYALLEDRITVDALKHIILKEQLCMQFVTVLAPNYDEAILTLSKRIEPKKKELVKKYQKELEAGDTIIADMVEKELLQYAQDIMKDDPAMDIFYSGARSDINNNFKNMFVWRGTVRDKDPNAASEYKVATSNYMDGIKKEEYSLYSNTGIEGAYARGKKTEDGGYLENLATSAYQDIILDEPGTDCKTDRHIEVVLTPDNCQRYMYNNIIGSNGKLTELNSKNKDSFMGKRVKMRMAYLCPHKHPCAACAGNFYYKLGMRNIGTSMMQVFSIYKNKAMKSFHDSTVQLSEIDPMSAFGLK